jgi:cell division septum initiation protein DivIVA
VAPDGAQAAAVLSHAQEVADQLLDAASRRAQEIIADAQRQGHEVVRQARIMTQDRMQSLYDELDGEFHRMGEAMRPSTPDPLPPAPPRYDI